MSLSRFLIIQFSHGTIQVGRTCSSKHSCTRVPIPTFIPLPRRIQVPGFRRRYVPRRFGVATMLSEPFFLASSIMYRCPRRRSICGLRPLLLRVWGVRKTDRGLTARRERRSHMGPLTSTTTYFFALLLLSSSSSHQSSRSGSIRTRTDSKALASTG